MKRRPWGQVGSRSGGVVCLDPDVFAAVKTLAEREGESRPAVASDLIREALEARKNLPRLEVPCVQTEEQPVPVTVHGEVELMYLMPEPQENVGGS